MFLKRKKSVFFGSLTIIALLLVFAGCKEDNPADGGPEAKTIEITITGVKLAELPDFHKECNKSNDDTTKCMAGFTVSLIPAGADVGIAWNIGLTEQKTVLTGPVVEHAIGRLKALGTLPPTEEFFPLTFKPKTNNNFHGEGEQYYVVFGVSNAMCKYNNQTSASTESTHIGSGLYSEGKMFITNATVAVSNGITITWDEFDKGSSGYGFSAQEIKDKF